MRVCVSLIVVALSVGSAIHAEQTPDALDDLLARGRAVRASVKTLTAGFTESTTSALLRDPLVASGTLVATTPLRVVMNYTSPTVKTVALDDTRLVVAWASRPSRENINIAETQRRVQKYFADASAKQLRDTFTIGLSRDPSLHDAYRLEMIPKRKQIAEGLQRLRIWIDPARLVLVKMAMDFPGGDTKTLELRDIVTNVPVDEHAFALLARPR